MSRVLQGRACCDITCIEIRAQVNQHLHCLDEAAACGNHKGWLSRQILLPIRLTPTNSRELCSPSSNAA